MKEAIGRGPIGADAFMAEGVVIADYAKIGEGNGQGQCQGLALQGSRGRRHPCHEPGVGRALEPLALRPYGVSGLANIELSPEFAAKLGAAFGATVGRAGS